MKLRFPGRKSVREDEAVVAERRANAREVALLLSEERQRAKARRFAEVERRARR
jgi:hypothetical protein